MRYPALLLLFALTLPVPASAQAPSFGAAGVQVNNQPLPPAVGAQLGPIQPGHYWYDAQSGAFGVWGGPTQGFLAPGLPITAPMTAQASNGTTGVFVNGRQLPHQDLQALHQSTGQPLEPGQYALDGQGNLAPHGGAPIRNLRQAAATAQSVESTPSPKHSPTGPQRFPGWNMRYTLPEGWSVVSNQQGLQVLRSPSSTGVILVQRALLRSKDELAGHLTGMARKSGVQLTFSEPLTQTSSDGRQVIEGSMRAQDGYGQSFSLELGAVLSGHGTGLVILAGSPSDAFGPVREVLESMVASARAEVPQYNNGAVQGQFSTYSSTGSAGSGGFTSSETFYRFDGVGRYSTNNNAMVSVSHKGTSDSEAPDYIDSSGYEVRFGGSSMSDISETSNAGTYAVLGDLLLIHTANGTSYHSFEIIGYTMDGVYTSNGIEVDGERYIRD